MWVPPHDDYRYLRFDFQNAAAVETQYKTTKLMVLKITLIKIKILGMFYLLNITRSAYL